MQDMLTAVLMTAMLLGAYSMHLNSNDAVSQTVSATDAQSFKEWMKKHGI